MKSVKRGMSFWQDAKQALRILGNAPWFTLGSVFLLALGIGATTAIFSLVDAALLRPLPFRDAEQLVMLWERSPRSERGPVPTLDFLDWKEQNQTFSGVAAVVAIATGTGSQFPLLNDGGGLPESVTLQTVTTDFFAVLGITPIAGRVFDARDDGDTGFVMSERLWRTRFGADPGIVGRSIRFGSPPRSRPIIGVVPASFRIFGAADLWEHLPVIRRDAARGQGVLLLIGRLKPQATLEQAQADMNVIARNIERISPTTNKDRTVTVEPLRQAIVGDDLRTTSLVLGGVVLFVLLLVCANVASLILARGVGRTREIAVRSALGGTRARVARQLFTESAVLGALGGVVGLVVAWALLQVAPLLVPPQTLPEPIVLSIDWRLGAFAVGMTLFTALLFGVAPAWQAAHVPLVEAMNMGGRGSSDRASRVRHSLAVIEVAVALLLMTGAGLLVRTLGSLNNVDPGYRADKVVTMTIRLPFRRLVSAKPGELAQYWQSMEDEVARVPGVRVAALGSDLPLDGLRFSQPFEIAGEPVTDPANRPTAHYVIVSPAFFTALGIPIARGRTFTERDTYDTVQVALVNEEFVRRHFADRDPIGAHITVQNPLSFRSPPVRREIVGVVPQVKARPDEPAVNALQVYVPLAQNNWLSPTLVVLTLEDPVRIVPRLKAAVARADPTQAVARIRTMKAVAAEATARPRFRAQLVTAFATLALILAAAGIFGVLSFMVQQRAREFSVRLAIGAAAGDLVRLVLKDGLKLTTAGIIVGLAASALLVRFLRTFLFGVSPGDPTTFIIAPAVLLLVALLACLVPALRALRADPVAALRGE